jgi:hypothetical protein
MKTFASTPRPTTSPWGKPDHAREIAPGIWDVSTPSHGGYLISRERFDAMPAHLQAFQPFSGTQGAYEEDCDVCVVVVAFPDCFERVAQARAIINANRGYYNLDVGTFAPADGCSRDD